MTPSEYTQFREDLGKSSGFQSHQYRLIEFMVGNRNKAMIKPHAHEPKMHVLLLAELKVPSLYDEALRLAHRKGIIMPDAVINRDISLAYEPNEDVMKAWAMVYQDTTKYWKLYELGRKTS